MSRRKILGDRYCVGEVIGSGAFSTVYSCEHLQSKERFAVKVMSKAALREAGMEEAFERECACLRQLKYSPFLCNLVEVLQSTRNYYIVMDLARNGTLLGMIVKSGGHGLPNHSVRKYFTQLLYGLRDMHNSGVVHRDIKPDNLLLDEWFDLKISDFGFAALADSSRTLTRQCGTPQYVAPEVLVNNGYFGTKADVWSAGVTLYVMLSRKLPFAATDHKRLFEQIVSGVYAPINRQQSDASVMHLLSCCLDRDPQTRWTVDELLRHPFVLGHDDLVEKPKRLPTNHSLTASSQVASSQQDVAVTRSTPEMRSLVRQHLGGRYDPYVEIGTLAARYWPVDRRGLVKRHSNQTAESAGSSTPPSSSSHSSLTPKRRRVYNEISATPIEQSRFQNRGLRRFGWVHAKVVFHFCLVCVVVVVVTLMRLLFGSTKWPLPNWMSRLTETLLAERDSDFAAKDDKKKV